MKAMSFITVTYNSEEHIPKCLSSIYKYVSGEYEIFVIDNNSSDRTVEVIEHEFDSVCRR